jgi:hypothetical protein
MFDLPGEEVKQLLDKLAVVYDLKFADGSYGERQERGLEALFRDG